MKGIPIISVDVFIFKKSKILLGNRIFNRKNTYCVPGGHLEFGETIRACAVREVREETGLKIKLEDIIGVHENNISGKHYVILCFKAEWVSGIPKNLENKNTNWKWYSKDNLPSPLFGMTERVLKNYKKNIIADMRKYL